MNAKLYLLLATLPLTAACSKTTDDTPANLTVEIPEITLPESAEGPQTATATFTTTAPWNVETSDTKAISPWVHVSPLSGGPGTVTLTITADENATPERREAYIRIRTGGVTKSITITQPGDGTLAGGQSIYEVGPARDTVVVKLRSGTEYQVDIQEGTDWVTFGYARGKKFDTVAFFLTANASMDDRTAEIRISGSNGKYKAGVTVIQPSAALNMSLELQKITLPTGVAGSDEAIQWIDSLFVAGFDQEGNLLFKHSILQVNDRLLRFRAVPLEGCIRAFYPSTRVYVVANNSGDLGGFLGTETDFVNRKDTAATKLFSTEAGTHPPLSAVVAGNLKFGDNKLAVNLSHVTAQVTFKVFFDSKWASPPILEKLSIGGFTSWGYLFTSKTDMQTAPQAATFNPALAPNSVNEYLFFAYEKSLLVLTVRAGGRTYRGTAPDILKRGYKYTFNMRLCEDGSCQPSSGTGQMSVAPAQAEASTIYMTPL